VTGHKKGSVVVLTFFSRKKREAKKKKMGARWSKSRRKIYAETHKVTAASSSSGGRHASSSSSAPSSFGAHLPSHEFYEEDFDGTPLSPYTNVTNAANLFQSHTYLDEGMNVSLATKRLFSVLRLAPDSDTVSSDFLIGILQRSGLLKGDPRLTTFFQALNDLGADVSNIELDINQFNNAIRNCRALVAKALHGDLVMPAFDQVFRDPLQKMFDEVKATSSSGHVADYIPELAKVDPDLFALSVTTIDGQHCSFGDANAIFCLQSCTKPLTYIMAIESNTEGFVHNHVGTEASGRPFNDVFLKEKPEKNNQNKQIPHNPMINAGAIMCTSMIYPRKSVKERIRRVIMLWREMSGPTDANKITCDEDTYMSEDLTADRNRCLAFMMKNRKSFPPDFELRGNRDLDDTLELYFRTCSLLSTTKLTSVFAATLANGGVNPLTGKRVVSALSVRHALSIMFSCGMYDYSGQWSYDIGVPAKSGVGGCVFFVIPNLCGIAVYSPLLDDCHNSVKALALADKLEKYFQFHTFEVFSGVGGEKVNPKEFRNESRYNFETQVMYSAQEGDVQELFSVYQADPEIWISDYDHRTPLHVAVAENHPGVVKFLVEHCPAHRKYELSAPDRWGAVPIDEAEEGSDCAIILEKAGLKRTRPPPVKTFDDLTDAMGEDSDTNLMSADAPRLLWASHSGFIDEMAKMAANGVGMDIMDYDRRTPLHLAACENQMAVAKYVAAQLDDQALKAALNRFDRFSNTPEMDAKRCNNVNIAQYLAGLKLKLKNLRPAYEMRMSKDESVASDFTRKSISRSMSFKKGDHVYLFDD